MALVVTLLVALAGTIVLGATVALAHNASRVAIRWRDDGSALYVAESGLNEALYRLKYEPGGLTPRAYPEDPPSFSGTAGNGSRYEVWVDRADADPDGRLVVAIGYQGVSRRLVFLAVEPLQANPYAAGDGGAAGGSAGHPHVPFPDLDCLGILHLTANREYVLGNADGTPAAYCYRGIIADGGSKLILRGPVHIWVTGAEEREPDIYLAGGSRLNVVRSGDTWVGGNPLDLLIWVPGSIAIDIDLLGNTQFYGGIWAPRSRLTVSGNATLVGGLVVDEGQIQVGGNSTLSQVYSHYDPFAGVGWPEGAQLDWVGQDYR